MIKTLDCLFLVVSSSKKSYQKLSETYSAIEPPTWALLLANQCELMVMKWEFWMQMLRDSQKIIYIKGYKIKSKSNLFRGLRSECKCRNN